MYRGRQKLHQKLIKNDKLPNRGIEPTTASIGGRFELGEPVLVIRDPTTVSTNRLLAELKIRTVYKRNTRRRTIKVYAGIAMLAFAREPSAKAKMCKNNIMDTWGN